MSASAPVVHGEGLSARYWAGDYGVAFSTLLSLYVVPSFYALLAPFTRSPDALTRKIEQLDAETPAVGGHA